jgi:LPXTG-motif cell wall-anchored protein
MTIGLIMSTTPLRGVSMAMIILGESISWPQILWGILILAGALWGTIKRRK